MLLTKKRRQHICWPFVTSGEKFEGYLVEFCRLPAQVIWLIHIGIYFLDADIFD